MTDSKENKFSLSTARERLIRFVVQRGNSELMEFRLQEPASMQGVWCRAGEGMLNIEFSDG